MSCNFILYSGSSLMNHFNNSKGMLCNNIVQSIFTFVYNYVHLLTHLSPINTHFYTKRSGYQFIIFTQNIKVSPLKGLDKEILCKKNSL